MEYNYSSTYNHVVRWTGFPHKRRESVHRTICVAIWSLTRSLTPPKSQTYYGKGLLKSPHVSYTRLDCDANYQYKLANIMLYGGARSKPPYSSIAYVFST
jgi:hypothetical protein